MEIANIRNSRERFDPSMFLLFQINRTTVRDTVKRQQMCQQCVIHQVVSTMCNTSSCVNSV